MSFSLDYTPITVRHFFAFKLVKVGTTGEFFNILAIEEFMASLS